MSNQPGQRPSVRARKTERFWGPIREAYDAIVVGAGLGGLVAASLLSRAGKTVLVLDGHYVAGGNATIFKRKNWEFDVGIHYLGDCGPEGTIPRILHACGVDDVRFLPMDQDLEQISFPDGEFTIPGNRDRFKDKLLTAFPNERRGIERYFRFLAQVEVMQKADGSRSRWRQLRGLIRSPLVVRYGLGPLGPFLDSCTKNPRLRALLTAQSGTYAIEPARVSAVLHAGLQNHYFINGGWYPEGGGQVMADRLTAEIERNGGHVRLRSKVSKIHVDDGAVVGVTVENRHVGEMKVAAPVVVSNADLKKTVLDLVGAENLPSAFVKQVNDFEMALPLFVVFLALDVDPADLPYGNCNRWIFADDDIDGEYARLARGEMKEQPSLYMATASKKDPENSKLAPAGQTNLQIMTVAPADPAFWNVTQEDIDSGRYEASEGYQLRKREVMQRVLTHAEKAIPGLADHIVFQEASTPMTHTRYTGSTGGTSYGIAATPGQFLQNRPSAKTPIDGLILAGASTRAGHGIVGAMTSGVHAADRVLRDGTARRILSSTA